MEKNQHRINQAPERQFENVYQIGEDNKIQSERVILNHKFDSNRNISISQPKNSIFSFENFQTEIT